MRKNHNVEMYRFLYSERKLIWLTNVFFSRQHSLLLYKCKNRVLKLVTLETMYNGSFIIEELEKNYRQL